MKCTNCGAEFEDGTLFCPKCGKEVQWVPEYHTLETILRQKELMEQEKKKERDCEEIPEGKRAAAAKSRAGEAQEKEERI